MYVNFNAWVSLWLLKEAVLPRHIIEVTFPWTDEYNGGSRLAHLGGGGGGGKARVNEKRKAK